MAIQLYQTADIEEQWQSVVAPWLRAKAGEAWRDVLPTVVLTPGRAESFYLRSRMVREQMPSLGLHFWTPSDARNFLQAEKRLEVTSATRAELRLVARACAERLSEEADFREPSLTSVAREPGPFLRAYDLLLGAGWDPSRDGAEYGRRLARELERTLANSSITSQAGLHRAIFQKRDDSPGPLLANLLVIGFNANHWPLWDLLRAMVATAAHAAIGLQAPRVFGEDIDQLWISSWEETAKVTVKVPEGQSKDRESPFESLVESYENGQPGDGAACEITFLATSDLASQAQAVTLQALEYLKRDSCERLGLVFPETNALALGVADELRRLGVPLDDGTGYLQPGCFERRPWQAWLKCQEEPSVQRLTEWLRACEAENVSCGSLDTLAAREIADTLDEALGESLMDQLDFLGLHLEQNSLRRRAPEAAEFLQRRIQLPASATFADFWTFVREALEKLGWNEALAALSDKAPCWLRESRWMISRRIFLEWLKESTDSRERVRGPDGNHFYGKVHLLIYAQMPGQTWTHLILTGLNEGQWPRLFEQGAFGSRHEWMTLNRKARKLNRRGAAQGAHGMGHEVVSEGHGYCLLPLEQQDLALRDLCAALDATSSAVCLTAMTTEGGRMLLPSDFFTHAYQAKMGHVLDESSFRVLAQTTHAWCRRHGDLLRTVPVGDDSPDLEATRVAYAARRDSTRPFGRYEYAYAEPPPEPVQLSCKTWETAWNHPGSIWLQKIIGVSPWPEGRLSWPRAAGTWVHRWLADALRNCSERNNPADFLRELRAAADREPERLQAVAERVGMTPYSWWNHVWGQARSIALALGETLAPHLQDCRFLSEFRLPGNLRIALPGTSHSDFQLKGRIDLILLQPGADSFDPTGGVFTDCACWVIDFKTGSAKNLSEKKLEKGIGLQTMLYALAVREAGAASVAASLHTFDAGVLKSQIQVEQVLGSETLFRSLDRLHRQGIFGQRAEAENEYGFVPAYPMATRPIPPAILEAKWLLTHGTPLSEEES